MKKIIFSTLIAMLIGCSEGSNPSQPVIDIDAGVGSSITNKRIEGQISEVGEVDVYRLKVVEANRNLQIKCTSETLRPDVDLLVNVYEEKENGQMVILAGNHAPEDSILAADIRVNLFIDKPKELFIFVRDLLDDDASDNSYFLSANLEAASDNNESFENALPVEIGGSIQNNIIGTVGDVDYFSFDVKKPGVYDITISFEPMPGTSVRLSIDLYNDEGKLLDSRTQGNSDISHMLHYLVPGSYKIVVDDDGRDDFDNASTYSVSISEVSVDEKEENDTPDKASAMSSIDEGVIGYYNDVDIYRIDTPSTPYINTMALSFTSDIRMAYQLSLYRTSADGNPDLKELTPEFSHDYRGGFDGTYQVVLKLDNLNNNERYYLAVAPLSGEEVAVVSPYTAAVNIVTIEDSDESGSGNDTADKALDLTTTPGPGIAHTGKLGYRGDIDWFEITVPLSVSDRVLSVYLDIPETEHVEYAMEIIRENRAGEGEDISYAVSEKVFNGSSDHRTVDLKTAFIVPAQSLELQNCTYKIKIYDFQNDDGDISDYELTWGLLDIPDSPISVPASVATALYGNEKDEADYDKTITIDYKNGSKGTFGVNTSILDVQNDTDASADKVTLPWVAGYIDYAGDEDWYGIDFSTLPAGDEKWHYEITVELHFPGSDKEYTLELYPDTNRDGKVDYTRCRNPNNCNGIFVSAGDETLYIEDYSVRVPEEDNRDKVLWVGSATSSHDWKGMVYFRISDFNYMFLEKNTPNPDADNDFGYDEPYFFRVKLNYVAGEGNPPEFN